MECLATVFHTRLQHSQRIHDNLIVLARILWEALAYGTHGIACRVWGFIDHVTDFHVGCPIFGCQCSISGGLCERMNQENGICIKNYLCDCLLFVYFICHFGKQTLKKKQVRWINMRVCSCCCFSLPFVLFVWLFYLRKKIMRQQ